MGSWKRIERKKERKKKGLNEKMSTQVEMPLMEVGMVWWGLGGGGSILFHILFFL